MPHAVRPDVPDANRGSVPKVPGGHLLGKGLVLRGRQAWLLRVPARFPLADRDLVPANGWYHADAQVSG